MNSEPLVLFDGPCRLCRGSIRFILKHEKEPVLQFASLQSDVAQKQLALHQIPATTDSMILIEDGTAFTESEAAFRLCKYLRKPWSLFYFLRHLPGWMHRPVYQWIARRRYKWFGKDESCPLPDPDQAERFL